MVAESCTFSQMSLTSASLNSEATFNKKNSSIFNDKTLGCFGFLFLKDLGCLKPADWKQ